MHSTFVIELKPNDPLGTSDQLESVVTPTLF